MLGLRDHAASPDGGPGPGGAHSILQRRGNMETNTGEAREKAKGSSGRERWGSGGLRRKGTVALDSRIREGSRGSSSSRIGEGEWSEEAGGKQVALWLLHGPRHVPPPSPARCPARTQVQEGEGTASGSPSQ